MSASPGPPRFGPVFSFERSTPEANGNRVVRITVGSGFVMLIAVVLGANLRSLDALASFVLNWLRR